jgi:PadR family transcriptional regulator PadR
MARTMAVMQGTLDLLILKAVASEPVHGWGIRERVEEMSRGAFRLGQGSVYPALKRLENRGWLLTVWRPTKNHRMARYYELSPIGRRALADEIDAWRDYAHAVDNVVNA